MIGAIVTSDPREGKIGRKLGKGKERVGGGEPIRVLRIVVVSSWLLAIRTLTRNIKTLMPNASNLIGSGT